MKYRGVAYYPEAWPMERWDRDVALMKEAGINLVRMGEFAWARFEPEDGRFDLDWWRVICEKFRAAGISVLACTPSAAPPAWLTTRYPETLPVAPDGSRPAHGTRRHYCPSSPRFRELAARIAEQLALAVRDNPAVIAWQLDNELAPEPLCHCPVCAAGFRAWLKQRYGTLKALNAAWGNVFWSGDFSTWEQIQPPRYRLSWQLDYQRFSDATFHTFIKEQTQVLRNVKPGWAITANLWAGLNPVADAALFFDGLDVAAFDGYWDVYAEREHYSSVWDFYRNIKRPRRPFWLTETGAWNPRRTVKNALAALRPWAFEAFAKGAEAHIYFRWRQSRMGEENHPAILDWTGRPGRPYEQVRSVFRDFDTLAPRLRDIPLPRPETAILFDYDTAALSRLYDNGLYQTRLIDTNILLNRMQTIADILPAREGLDLSPYRLLILPRLEMVDPWLAAALDRFVASGGVVLAQTRLAVRDRNGKYLMDPMPAGLTGLFGVDVLERGPVQNAHVRLRDKDEIATVAVSLSANGKRGKARGLEHMERLSIAPDCVCLGKYASGEFAGDPAVTERKSGDGWAIYQGCRLDEAATRRLLAHAFRRAGIALPPPAPAGVESIPRGSFRFYLNHNAKAVTVPLVSPGKTVVGKVKGKRAHLEPFGVCVIEENRNRNAHS